MTSVHESYSQKKHEYYSYKKHEVYSQKEHEVYSQKNHEVHSERKSIDCYVVRYTQPLPSLYKDGAKSNWVVVDFLGFIGVLRVD